MDKREDGLAEEETLFIETFQKLMMVQKEEVKRVISELAHLLISFL